MMWCVRVSLCEERNCKKQMPPCSEKVLMLLRFERQHIFKVKTYNPQVKSESSKSVVGHR